MLMNYAQAFTILSADLEKARAQILILAVEGNLGKIDASLPKMAEFRGNISTLAATCQQVPQLDRMLGPIGRLMAAIDTGIDASTFHHQVDFIQAQLFDELNRMKLYHVRDELAAIYDHPQPFGQAVFDAFPSAILDTQNAGKCLALGQPTACMFHLMRVMEHGLTAYAAKLGINYLPSWEAFFS
jgi:hypothetical protein